ncbi:tripartite tricarboxylate transporter substrate binding protein [Jiangella asiatica]|uniref:Tripartite tricarboxylate transporter substrate binding protein n=1 Tax=Jiangella asiatica TaxID=2530372 RepID=A0A4R5DF79_9ACTN|nr:tripartite tricarboxylate transporter substrate-binding protein [Jiangella asiatica]TDE11827.1 tripartite tricarboxylate transporter substrate binding protein [Jiangella asiatica]
MAVNRSAVRVRLAAAAAGLAVLASCTAQNSVSAENYPRSAVRLVAPAAAGGGYDTTARTILEVVKDDDLVEVPMTVENRDGADGSVWMAEMSSSFEGADNVISVGGTASMYNDVRGETEATFHDVTPIAALITEYYVLVVPADSPYDSLDDVLQAVLDDPQSVPVGGGSLDRAVFDLLVLAAGGDPSQTNFVVYPTGAEQVVGLLNGDLAVGVSGTPEFAGQIASGDLQALAVTSDERLSGEPYDDVPSVTELGYEVSLANWRCVYGPAGMPDYAVRYWRGVLEEMVGTDAWGAAAERNQWETTFTTGPDLTELIDTTYQEIEDAYRAAGVID